MRHKLAWDWVTSEPWNETQTSLGMGLGQYPYLPVVEDREAEGLPLRVSTEVRLKPKGVNSRDERFDGVERGAWYGSVLCHMTPGKEEERTMGWESICKWHMLLTSSLPVQCTQKRRNQLELAPPHRSRAPSIWE